LGKSRENSQERISGLEAETAHAKLEFAKAVEETTRLSANAEASRAAIAGANERTAKAAQSAAEANERAALAEQRAIELKYSMENLEKQVGPRFLNQQEFMDTLKGGPTGKFEIIYGAEDQDSWALALQIGGAMKRAGWTELREVATPVAEIIKRAKLLPQTVMIEVKSFDYDTEAPAMLALSVGRSAEHRTLYVVASAALIRGLGRGVTGGQDPQLRSDEVRIIIFPR
jgi:sensor c-di-GMP phosphodiesterase-like protein